MKDANTQQPASPYPNQTQAIGGDDSPAGQINLKHVFNKYFVSHWYLYVYTLSLALITAYFYNWYSTPIYYTSSTLLIKDNSERYNSNDLLSQLASYNNEGSVDNEIGIIRSRQLISKTLKSLEYQKNYYLKGDIKTSEIYKDNPIRLNEDSLYPVAYNTTFYVDILSHSQYRLTFDVGKKEFVGYYLFGKKVKTYAGVFSIDKTPEFNDAAFDNKAFKKRNLVISLGDIENMTDMYQGALKADKVNSQATLLQLSVQGPVPAKNEAFLNKLCEFYIEKGIEVKNEYAVNTLKFIDEQVKLLTSDIDANEANVEQFRVRRGITDISIEAGSYLESVKMFDYKISDLQVQLKFLDYLETYVSGGKELSGNISPASILVDDPLLRSLVIKLNDLVNKRKSTLSMVKADNPLLVSLNIEIQNTKGALQENIKSLRNGLQASLNEALLQKSGVQNKLRLLPSAQRELQSMMRGSNIKETLYSYLLQKRAETAILLASTTADNRVVDQARTFQKPLKPVKSLSYSIALILGLIIPGLIVYFRDLLNDKVNDRFDLERMKSVPVLGMIGLTASKSNLVVT